MIMIQLIKVYISPFIDNSKWTKNNLQVKIFLNLLGTYKEVRKVADITTTPTRN